MKDIPASLDSLASGAGADPSEPGTALVNSLGNRGFSGVNPPSGTGTHRLFIAAPALSVPVLEIPDGASAALVNVLMIQHTVGRGILVGTSTAL